MSAPVSEAQRLHLFKTFEGLFPDEDVATLMAVIPPFDWNEVATKTDLEHLRVATKTDIEQLRAATKTDIEHLRAATKTDIEHLRAATKADIEREVAAVRLEIADLRREIRKAMHEQTNRLMTALLGSVGTLTVVFSTVVAVTR